MNTNKTSDKINKRKTILSALWIFVTLNYLYCDIMALMDPTLLKQFLSGSAGGFQITQEFLLGAAILMEIPISMVFLSRLFKYSTNRRANIIAGIIMTIVQIASLFAGTPTLYYLFFSVIEISCTIAIVWIAWKWTKPLEILIS